MSASESERNNETTIASDEQGAIQRDESLNMDAILEASKAKNSSNSEETDMIENADHGDIVELEDGTTGIVIDGSREKDKIANSMKMEKLEKLIDKDTQIYERVCGGSDEPEGIDDGIKIIQKDPMSEDAQAILEVKRAFSEFAPTAHGLASSNSDEATKYSSAMKDLREGKYVLPSVDEYMKQKAEIAKRKKEQEEKRKMENQNNQNVEQPIQNNNMSKQSEQTEEPRVLNLAAMEEAYQRNVNGVEPPKPVEQVPVSAQNMKPAQVTEFKVPEGKASEFISSLTPEEQEKVEASKTIKVKEERTVKVPVATRRITSIDEFKRIASNKVTSEAVEVPLLNSGYVAVVKGCGSLEMASILPNVRDMEWEDYAKLYNFCFKNLVSTSVGTMSFRDFQVKTSPYDLDAMVHAILRASQPNEQSITLTCGGENCGKDYDIQYFLTDLTDWDNVGKEKTDRIDELLRVKDIIEDAKKVQEESPVMTRKYVDIGDGKIVCIKSPNGPMIIERTNVELMQAIADKTSPIVSIFLFNIEKIYVDIPDEKGEPQTYELVDPEVIASEIQTFSDTQLEIIKEELKTLKIYDQYTYSFKGKDGGNIVCPHCGLANKSVPCNVQQLVFQRVSRAMN